MNREDFESKLRSLRLRQPSRELDERILAARTGQAPTKICQSSRRISLRAAVAASLAAGLIGFAAGLAVREIPPGGPYGPVSPAAVQVIYHDPSTGDPFDFTRVPGDVFPGQLKVTSQTVKGIGT